jgi:glycosyltransferase involved in cell wall biosynthesis
MKPLCLISCPIDTFSGYGARSRDFVRALFKLKEKEWDIRIIPQRWGDCPWGALNDNDPLKLSYNQEKQLSKQPDIWVQITVPNEFQPIGKFNIGVTAGIETTAFPPEFIDGMNRMNLNLVSSEHSKNIALATNYDKFDKNTKQKIGVLKLEKPIQVLLEGLNLETYHKIQKFDTKKSLLKEVNEDFCFLYTGHWLPGKFSEDRKNTPLLIQTFLKTFKNINGTKPALILKTNKVNYSLLDREEILKEINNVRKKVGGNLPSIYLLHGEMTDEEMNLLNNDPKVKAMVSFTKGEGFGRPLLEGAITGKPTIVSNWSGHIDFIRPEYNCLIGGELTNVHESAANKFLMKESQWFSINTSIASKAMKDVFKHYKKYWEKSRKQTQYLKENWSLDKMVEKLSTLLSTLTLEPPKQHVPLNLPNLKKVNTETPKIKLPKLKKINA